MREVTVTGTLHASAERDGRTRIRHANRVTRPNRAQQLVGWALATGVLQVQPRNLRRELDR